MKDAGGRILATLVGCIVSLLVMVATLGAAPSKADISKMIQLEAPYVADRSLILYRLEQIEKKLDLLLTQE